MLQSVIVPMYAEGYMRCYRTALCLHVQVQHDGSRPTAVDVSNALDVTWSPIVLVIRTECSVHTGHRDRTVQEA